jgi:hypothetical protein
LLFIIVGGLFPGGLALIFNGGNPICFLSVAGSGIPGVGVKPGFSPFLSCSALGMPGVGVFPTGNTPPFAGMPGTPFIGIGLPERPGGILAGSSFMTFAFDAPRFESEFALDVEEEPQADRTKAAASEKTKFLNIYYSLVIRI